MCDCCSHHSLPLISLTPLQAKLRHIGDEAAEAAAMPVMDPVPEVFLTPQRTAEGRRAPATPQLPGWRSPAESTNGR